MKALSASQRETLTTLANVYYEVVPVVSGLNDVNVLESKH